jgi:hypothetical protein
MGPGKYENVGKSQPVLIMINPIILTRTRMLGAVLCCAVCLCQGDFGPLLEAVAVARVQAGTGVTPPGAVPPCIVDDEHDDETAAEIDHHQRQLHGPTVVSVVSGSEPFPIYIYIYMCCVAWRVVHLRHPHWAACAHFTSAVRMQRGPRGSPACSR